MSSDWARVPYVASMRNGAVLVAGAGNVCLWQYGVSKAMTKELQVGSYTRLRDGTDGQIIGAHFSEDDKIVVMQKKPYESGVVRVEDKQETVIQTPRVGHIMGMNPRMLTTDSFIILVEAGNIIVLERRGKY